ncbi:hypothetical protein ASG43_19860 [Aureimonas sp. Leaf454]|nr:hypothetical protein ASG43_19860 [Aureimonas sp. Leaf454]
MRRGIAGFLGLVVLSLALGTLVPRRPVHPTGGRPGHHRILVLANAIHTDIALPVDRAIRERFAFLEEAGLPVERADHLLIGRGGRSFYVETPNWSDLRPLPLLRSFTLDEAVMHVGLAGPIADGEAQRTILLDDAAFEALLAAIEASFASRNAIPGAAYGPYDRFFEATGSFNALLGCNVWTAATLRRAGIATGLWTPLPRLLLWSLDLHGGSLDRPGRSLDRPG